MTHKFRDLQFWVDLISNDFGCGRQQKYFYFRAWISESDAAMATAPPLLDCWDQKDGFVESCWNSWHHQEAARSSEKLRAVMIRWVNTSCQQLTRICEEREAGACHQPGSSGFSLIIYWSLETFFFNRIASSVVVKLEFILATHNLQPKMIHDIKMCFFHLLFVFW